jgi:Golgi nucleoside diphosphatase
MVRSNRRLCISLAAFSASALFLTSVVILNSTVTTTIASPTADESADALSYGVVIDAGSSGSRLFVYVWPPHSGDDRDLLQIRPLLNPVDGKPIVKKTSPGLSSLNFAPNNATNYLRPLLDYAAEHIPKAKQRDTLVFVLATAGLRLLPERQSFALLENLRQNLPRLYDFIILPEQIALIPGKWEGIYSWIAVNYVLGQFDRKQKSGSHAQPGVVPVLIGGRQFYRKATVGMIDMGGGSVQIAFEIDQNKNLPPGAAELLADIDLGHGKASVHHRYRLYVTTFLGLGANSAKRSYERMLRQKVKEIEEEEMRAQSYHHQPDEWSRKRRRPTQLADPCLPRNRTKVLYVETTRAWSPSHRPKVVGTRLGTGDFMACYRRLVPLLAKDNACPYAPCSMNGVFQPDLDFSKVTFYGFSEIWYGTNDILGIGGPYDYSRFRKSSQKYCETNWNTLLRRYRNGQFPHADKARVKTQCFKSAWMAAVIHDGFGFPRDPRPGMSRFEPPLPSPTLRRSAGNIDAPDAGAQLITVQEINGAEVQWTLGALLFLMRKFALANSVPNTAKRVSPSSFKKQVLFGSWLPERASRQHPVSFLVLFLLLGCLLGCYMCCRLLVVSNTGRRWRRRLNGSWGGDGSGSGPFSSTAVFALAREWWPVGNLNRCFRQRVFRRFAQDRIV